MHGDEYKVEFDVAPCMSLYANMDVGQDQTCVKNLILTYKDKIYEIEAHTGQVNKA